MNEDRLEKQEREAAEELIKDMSVQIGNSLNYKARAGTEAAERSMDALIAEGIKHRKVNFDQAKGNLFEYLESGKLDIRIANETGDLLDKLPVTDAKKELGGRQLPHHPADFIISHKGKISYAQAKYNNSPHKAAVNFCDTKYRHQQRIAPVDQIEDIRQEIIKLRDSGAVSKAMAEDALENLKSDGLEDAATGITTSGTTRAEIQSLKGRNGKISQSKVREMAEDIKSAQYRHEIMSGAATGAASSAIMSSLVAGASNIYSVLNDEKTLKEALKDVGKSTIKGAAYGGSVGALSAGIRTMTVSGKIPVSGLANADIATIIASSTIDTGIAIYDYAKGNISGQELKEQLQDTAIKSTTTIYFTQAVKATFGTAGGIFLPLAVLSAAQVIISGTRAIIKQHELMAEEYRRVAALYQESIATARLYRKQVEDALASYRIEKRYMLETFMNDFQYDLRDDYSYTRMIAAMTCLAERIGIELKYTDMDDFQDMMLSEEDDVIL